MVFLVVVFAFPFGGPHRLGSALPCPRLASRPLSTFLTYIFLGSVTVVHYEVPRLMDTRIFWIEARPLTIRPDGPVHSEYFRFFVVFYSASSSFGVFIAPVQGITNSESCQCSPINSNVNQSPRISLAHIAVKRNTCQIERGENAELL